MAADPRRTIEVLLRADNRLPQGLGQAGKDIERFASRGRASLQNLASGFLSLRGLMYTAGIAGAVRFGRSVITAGDQVDQLAGRLSLTTEEFQVLAHAMTLSDSSAQALEPAFRQLSAVMLDAGVAGSQAERTLASLGISLTQLAGRTPYEQFTMLAAAVSRVGDPTRAAAMAQEIFGRSAMQLIPMLKAYNGNLDELRAKMIAAGQIMSEEQIRKASDLNDAYASLNVSIRALAFDVMESGVTSLTEAINGMTETLGELNASQAFGGMVQDVATLISGISSVVGWVGQLRDLLPQGDLGDALMPSVSPLAKWSRLAGKWAGAAMEGVAPWELDAQYAALSAPGAKPSAKAGGKAARGSRLGGRIQTPEQIAAAQKAAAEAKKREWETLRSTVEGVWTQARIAVQTGDEEGLRLWEKVSGSRQVQAVLTAGDIAAIGARLQQVVADDADAAVAVFRAAAQKEVEAVRAGADELRDALDNARSARERLDQLDQDAWRQARLDRLGAVERAAQDEAAAMRAYADELESSAAREGGRARQAWERLISGEPAGGNGEDRRRQRREDRLERRAKTVIERLGQGSSTTRAGRAIAAAFLAKEAEEANLRRARRARRGATAADGRGKRARSEAEALQASWTAGDRASERERLLAESVWEQPGATDRGAAGFAPAMPAPLPSGPSLPAGPGAPADGVTRYLGEIAATVKAHTPLLRQMADNQGMTG